MAGFAAPVAAQVAGPPQPAGAVAESVLPLLAYGPSCTSAILLRNLGDGPADVELEGHRASGGLAPLAGQAGRVVHLAAGAEGSYQLDIPEKDTGAWVRVRERTAAHGRPAVAVHGTAECREGNQLRAVARQVAFPTRDPWYGGDVAGLHGAVLSVLNSSAAAARATVCYSSGNLYSVPGETQASRELQPVCSSSFEVQIPPYGTRYFPVESEGNVWVSLRTRGDAVVLQLLRPATEGVRTFSVDSSIKFGGEVPAAVPAKR